MSRVDDRIKARLQMQIVLRGIAVLMVAAGVVVCLVWFVSPIVEAIARRSNNSGPTLSGELRRTSDVLSVGLCLMIPGVLLLKACDWLSMLWVPLKSAGLCAKCGYPRDDMSREKCPDCGERLFTPTAHHGRNVQRVTGETI